MNRGQLNKLIKGEKGQALLIVMILTCVGGLIVSSMLGNISTGLNTGKKVYEENMYLSYAADSGVEDALWQVKNKQLPTLLDGYIPAYDQYAYYDKSSSYEWGYNLEDEYGTDVGLVNDKEVNVTFQNVWMPKGISAPSPSEAKSIAEEGRLAVFGSMSGASATEYQIKILYYYNDQTPAQPDYDPAGAKLRVGKLGIWLPPGFHYKGGTTNLTGGCAPSSETVDPYKGGEAVVWTFGSSPHLSDFPSGSDSVNPMVKAVTFQFTGEEGRTPGTALSWIISNGVSGISYSWDSSVKVYKMTSVASDDTNEFAVDAYAAMTDMLKRGAAISGDYCAIGGTLMKYTDDEYYRDMLFKESTATVQDTNKDAPFYVPDDAHLDLAYLYWSGWIDKAGIWGESCEDFSDWIQDNDWTNPQSGGWGGGDYEFKGHHITSGTRYLKMSIDLNLSYYVGQTVSVTWQQRKDGTMSSTDGLKYSFSRDGGSTWMTDTWSFNNNGYTQTKTVVIPSDYLTSQFRLRFKVEGCTSSGKNVYVDDIIVSVGGTVMGNARVNQVMFNGVKITADPMNIQTKQSSAQGAPDSLSYSCFYDATALVLGMIQSETLGSNGTGTYTVGHVLNQPGSYDMHNYPSGTSDGTTAFPLGTPAQMTTGENPSFPTKYQWSYAAWSLVIVYSSPETQGHQLYLYDDLYYCPSNPRDPLEFTIGGFIAPDAIKDEDHAAHLTCFVGEGDEVWSGDYIAVNTVKLWDGTTSTTYPPNNEDDPRNCWNDKSHFPAGTISSGIDIDTFTVKYPTIIPNATEADVLIHTDSDSWNLIYMILSFRSELIPASTISYLVR